MATDGELVSQVVCQVSFVVCWLSLICRRLDVMTGIWREVEWLARKPSTTAGAGRERNGWWGAKP
jgi:hypothetical protein